jgi:hypothetical protein
MESTFGLVGEFDFVIERANGEVERFSKQNKVTDSGLHLLLTGIGTTAATTNDPYAGTPKCGIFISQTDGITGSNGDDGSNYGIDLGDSTGSTGTAFVGTAATSVQNVTADSATTTATNIGGQLGFLTDASDACVFTSQAVADASTGTGKSLTTKSVKVTASGDGDTVNSVGLCDASETTASTAAKVFCCVDVTVALTAGDSLTVSYKLTVS